MKRVTDFGPRHRPCYRGRLDYSVRLGYRSSIHGFLDNNSRHRAQRRPRERDLNGHESISIAVLTSKQDDVELVNQTLRNAGFAARCCWIKSPAELDSLLNEAPPELIILDTDSYPDSIRQVIKQKDVYQPELSVLAVQSAVDEASILSAMRAGAVDLVSISNRERLQAVVTRELRAGRIERALNSTLQSATAYRKQLTDYMEGSNRAIAYVHEGIVTNVNKAWLELFKQETKDAIVGLPLMDSFESESQAALKGAIIATTKGKWQDEEKLIVSSRLGGNRVQELELEFQLAELDEGKQVQLRIARTDLKPEEPTRLVHDALKRDPTTLFFHRNEFLERITKRLAKKPKSGTHVLVYIKPDDFKGVIRRCGLIASEEVLAQFAEVVRKRMHPRDVAGRFEGTVLMALLERGNERDAAVWAQQLVDQVRETKFVVRKVEAEMTCTVGVCAVSGVFENMDELVSAAAQAHAQAKGSGGNAVATCDSPDEDTKQRRHDAVWAKRIKAAVTENRLRLAHLPIAGLRSDSLSMFDMLIRMLDEQGKAILPSEFLPAAQRTNLMNVIDRWMIGATLDYCAAEGADRAFVRLSMQSLMDRSFLPWLQSEFAKHQIEPGRLCLQFGEQDAARYIKDTKVLVAELRKVGVAFALEHYGVDQGRMQILDMLKPDYIKIDGELMYSLTTDPEMQDQVRKVVSAATQRGIETIAERVENANTMAVLFQLGFHFMQGHYVHEPEVVLQEAARSAPRKLEAMSGG